MEYFTARCRHLLDKHTTTRNSHRVKFITGSNPGDNSGLISTISKVQITLARFQTILNKRKKKRQRVIGTTFKWHLIALLCLINTQHGCGQSKSNPDLDPEVRGPASGTTSLPLQGAQTLPAPNLRPSSWWRRCGRAAWWSDPARTPSGKAWRCSRPCKHRQNGLI